MPLNEAQFQMLDEYVRGQLEHTEQVCIHQGILEKKFGIDVPFYKDLIGFMQNVKGYYVCPDGEGWTYADEPIDLKFIRGELH